MRTSLYTVLCIAIRLGAVALAVDTIYVIPTAWSMVGSTTMSSGWDGAVIGFGVAMFALATLLLIYPGILARLAAGRSAKQVFESPISPDEIQQIALCTMGVWFVANGLIDVVGVGIRTIFAMNVSLGGNGMGFGEIVKHDIVRDVSAILKLLVGIALTLGARGLVGVVRRMREGGLPSAVEIPAEGSERS